MKHTQFSSSLYELDDKLVKKLTKLVSSHNIKQVKGEGTFEVVASTDSFDRDGERILVEGWELDNFKKNPILLWGHNYFEMEAIIGAVTDIKIEEKQLVMKGIFANTEEGQRARQLYDDGILKAVSVGFIVKDWDENSKTIKQAELLELSFVTVPANPDALTLEKAVKHINRLESLIFNGIISKAKGKKSVVSFEETGSAPEDMDWDASGATQRLQEWATATNEDGEEIIDFEKYGRAFTWYDENDPELLGSYKLPHHDIIDGELSAVWRGVAAAMAALLGARGGVDIPEAEKEAVYNHLVKHYEQFDKEAPDFSSTGEPEGDDEKNIKLTQKSIDGLKADINAIIDSYIQVEKAKTAKKGQVILTAKTKAVIERAIASLSELIEFAGVNKDDEKSLLQDQIKLAQTIDKSVEELIKGLKQAT